MVGLDLWRLASRVSVREVGGVKVREEGEVEVGVWRCR